MRVNLDTLKTHHQEKLLIEECMQNESNFSVDNTNPTRLDREHYIKPAKEAGYHVIGYFLESKIKDCIQRNALREGKSIAFKNELLFSRGINFDKLPSWQKRGVGVFWDDVEKVGYNPITKRSRLFADN